MPTPVIRRHQASPQPSVRPLAEVLNPDPSLHPYAFQRPPARRRRESPEAAVARARAALALRPTDTAAQALRKATLGDALRWQDTLQPAVERRLSAALGEGEAARAARAGRVAQAATDAAAEAERRFAQNRRQFARYGIDPAAWLVGEQRRQAALAGTQAAAGVTPALEDEARLALDFARIFGDRADLGALAAEDRASGTFGVTLRGGRSRQRAAETAAAEAPRAPTVRTTRRLLTL